MTPWTPPPPMTAHEAFRFCARRALTAHKAGQAAAARFWFDRAAVFAERSAS